MSKVVTLCVILLLIQVATTASNTTRSQSTWKSAKSSTLTQKSTLTQLDAANVTTSACCKGAGVFPEPNAPFVVKVGVYITQVTSLDQVGTNYFGTGYFWFKWNSCYVTEDGPYIPSKSILIVNNAQYWSAIITPETEEPECDVPEEGYSYQRFHFNLNLGFQFIYTQYPLDEQELYVAFEDYFLDVEQLILEPDTDSDYSNEVYIPSFSTSDPLRATGQTHRKTSFGQPGVSQRSYSHAKLGLHIKRRLTYFFIKIMPPIIITMLVCLLALSIDPCRVAERLFLVPGGMTSLITLQLGFSAEYAEGVLSVTDWIFNWLYLLTLIMMLQTGFMVLLTSKWELRVARVGIGAYSDPESIARSVRIIKVSRRIALVIDYITGVLAFFGTTVGTILVIIIAVYA